MINKWLFPILVSINLAVSVSCTAASVKNVERKMTMDYPAVSQNEAISVYRDILNQLEPDAAYLEESLTGDLSPQKLDELKIFLKSNSTPFIPPNDPKWNTENVANRLNEMIICLAKNGNIDDKSVLQVIRGIVEHAEYIYTFDTGSPEARTRADLAMAFAGQACRKLSLSNMWRMAGMARFATVCSDPKILRQGDCMTRFKAILDIAVKCHLPIVASAADLYEKTTGTTLANVGREHYKLSDTDYYGQLIPKTKGLAAVEKALARNDTTAAKQAYVVYLSRIESLPSKFFTADSFDLHDPVKEEPDEICRNLLTLTAHNQIKHDYGKQVDWTTVLNNDVETNVSINGHQHISILADAYRKTGDEKYAQNMARLWDSWYVQSPCPDTKASLQWRTLEVGNRMADRWPWIWYQGAKSKEFRDKILFNMAKSYLEHARYLSTYHSGGGNWAQVETSGLLCASILFPEWKESDRLGSIALRRLSWFDKGYFFADGFQTECSTLYHRLPYGMIANAHGLAKAMKCALPQQFVDEFEKITVPLIYTSQPDYMLPMLNDGNPQPVDVPNNMRMASAVFPNRTDFQYMRTEGKEGKPPAHTSYAFPDAGFYIMRDSWDRSSPYFLFDAGYFGSGHQHEDKLNFVLYAYGRPLIGDPGIYGYVTDPFLHYFQGTYGHNCIVIDGKEQCRRLRLVKEEIPDPDTQWITRKEFDFAQGWYKAGFSTRGTKDDKANAEMDMQHERIVFHPRSGYFIIHDRVLGDPGKERTLEQLFHLSPVETNASQHEYEPGSVNIAQNNTAVTSNSGVANITIIPVQPDGISKAEDLCGQTEPRIAGWTSLYGKQPSHDIVYTRNSTLPASFDTVLFPTPAGVNFTPDAKTISVVSEKHATAFKITGPDFVDVFIMSDDGPCQITAENEGISFFGELLYIRLTPQHILKDAMMVKGKTLVYDGKEIVNLPNTEESWALTLNSAN